MKREEIKNRLNDVEALITESKYTVQVYKQERKQLKKQLEELPKLEVGKWYKNTDSKSLFCVTGFRGINFKAYGFGGGSANLKWYDNTVFGDTIGFNRIPVTPKEVEKALTKEAVKRGFKEGVRSINIFNSVGFTPKNNDIRLLDSGELVIDNNTIFNRTGRWATIIKENTLHLEEGDYTKIQLLDLANNRF